MNVEITQTTDFVNRAIRDCRAEQERWRERSLSERLRPIAKLRRLLVSECDALCVAVYEDVGKNVEEVIGGEVLPVADACHFLEREAKAILRPKKVSWRSRPIWLWGQRDIIHRRSRGVVGIIGTWNYPLFLNGVQIIQAVTAGNGVVWKPSEVAPASAVLFKQLLDKAGFPPSLIQLLPATREGGPQLIEGDIDHLVFTGSASVGRHIAARLGQRLISSTLELSGCDPMFVLPDADLDLAATAAWFGATLNRGQTCIAVRRLFVHRSLYSELTQRLESLVKTSRPVQLALASQARQAEQLLEDAEKKGARLLRGDGTDAKGGSECLPTVILDASNEMQVFREASFAPLLAVVPYDDLDKTLTVDSLCPYGLGASIFTRKPREVETIAAKLRTGMVTINDVIAPTAHPATPFGGVRDSGWGVTQGAEGLLEMTVPQVVSVRKGTFRPHYELVTKEPGQQEGLLRGLLRFCHGRGFLERWRGFRQMLSGLKKK